MSAQKLLTIRIWPDDDAEPLPDDASEIAELMVEHVERVARQCSKGYVAGEICGDTFRGWWEIKQEGAA